MKKANDIIVLIKDNDTFPSQFNEWNYGDINYIDSHLIIKDLRTKIQEGLFNQGRIELVYLVPYKLVGEGDAMFRLLSANAEEQIFKFEYEGIVS